jgi:hypothetical protein
MDVADQAIEKDTCLHSGDEDSLADEQSDLPIRGRSDLSQLSTVHSDDQAWNPIQIEKNTFVHFVDEASLAEQRLHLYFRRRSDPACCIELRDEQYSSEMYASTEAPDSAMLSEGYGSVASESDMQESADALEVRGDETFVDDVKRLVHDDVEDARINSCSKGKTHGKGRPCKGKRIRFKKFVERVQNQITADPCGFDLENLEWPAVLLDNDLNRIRTKVLANLRAYRSELIAELSNGGVNQPKVQLNLAQFL